MANTYGQGSVYADGRGRWVYEFRADGIRRRWRFHTKREATAKRVEVAHAYRRGLRPPPAKRVGTFLAEWLAHVATRDHSPATLRIYRWAVGHLTAAVGGHQLAELDAGRISAMLAGLADHGGLSAVSCRKVHSVLRAALAQAERWDDVPRNTARLVTPPAGRSRQANVLTLEEARAAIEAVAGHRLGALYLFALTTGVRSGEATGLRWGDVDLETASVTISRQSQRIGGQWLTRPPKMGARRTLHLPPPLIVALRAHRARQAEERLAAGDAWADHDLVFCRDQGGPLHPSTINTTLQRLLRYGGVPVVRFHELRHSAATAMLALGVPAVDVSKYLGHSAVAITTDLYGHASPEGGRRVARAMTALFSPEVPTTLPNEQTGARS